MGIGWGNGVIGAQPASMAMNGKMKYVLERLGRYMVSILINPQSRWSPGFLFRPTQVFSLPTRNVRICAQKFARSC